MFVNKQRVFPFCLLFIIAGILSCTTPAPPEVLLKSPGGEIILIGTRDLPAENENLPKAGGENPGKEETAFYFTFPADLAADRGTGWSLYFTSSPLPEIYLHGKSGAWQLLDLPVPAAARANLTLEVFLTGREVSDLSGMAMVLPEKSPGILPEIRFSSGIMTADAIGSRLIEGLSFREITGVPGSWEISGNPEQWTPSLQSSLWTLELKYTFHGPVESPDEQSRLLIMTAADGSTGEFDFFPKQGSRSLFFNSERYDGFPEKITIKGGTGFSLDSLVLTFREPSPEGSPEPIPADTGTILHYPVNRWRNRDFELFRWNLYPEIIHLSSRSYAVQSRFLKRLAFYVEKPGFAGRLAPNSEIESLHGWNAHDYDSKDMAAFFQQARDENFSLNPEEELLKQVLLQADILREEGDRIAPGKGALVGTSPETFYEQRLIFTAHEFLHGIYFISPEFRRECEDFWESLSADEQRFWINFLSYRGYNVPEDRDLLINETAIFLLQQPAEEADDYFIGFITPRLLASRTHLKGELIPFLKANPEVFSRQVREMEKRLFSITGFTAGTIHDLLPRDRSGWKIFRGLKAKWFASLDDRT